ncbi:MAG: hypothetical protein JWM32_2520 [Verrucomicrobia bacterium]|nr:hypothetical protein [Verrucomicrobiota bacterium]
MKALIPSVLALLSIVPAALVAAETALPDQARLEAMTARFVPVDVKVDTSSLPANEQLALAKMIEAARILDALFLRQSAPLNETVLAQLVRDETPLGRARLHFFRLNVGPWSRLDENAPFIPGVGTRPPAGNFYPPDATRAEVDTWINSLAPAERSAAMGFFTTIRRTPTGALATVPYSMEYQGELAPAAKLLREAAAATTQPTLKSFLEKRAAAFLSNDYYDSDVAWMELDATIEPTIGPYETYEDEWFNYKAAFEAFITLTDAKETSKLVSFSSHLQELEDHLPIDPAFRRPKLGGYSPIRVVNVAFCAGDGNRGVQTAAFNLPNDERVVTAKGSKRVLLKNFQEIKFSHVLVPIAAHAVNAQDRGFVAFDSFFTHILMHELMHGLGPQSIKLGDRATTVREEMKELGGTLEEAKADISGLWALQYLMDHGMLDKAQERSVYVTFLVSSFRTFRFGITEAHAKGMALQFNWLLDCGGFTLAPDGSFGVNLEKVKAGVAGLTTEIMTIQATGNYARAKALLDRMVVIRPEVKRMLERLNDVPVDFEPRFR